MGEVSEDGRGGGAVGGRGGGGGGAEHCHNQRSLIQRNTAT